MADVLPKFVKNPLIVMDKTDSGVRCILNPDPEVGHDGFGLLVCDLVRHIAGAFGVEEDDVWEWVDKERAHHTTEIRRPS
jgi:hypothetical protein